MVDVVMLDLDSELTTPRGPQSERDGLGDRHTPFPD